jgi:LEA14-like dessication related protein
MKKIGVLLAGAIIMSGCTKPKDLEFVDIQNIRMVNLGLTESQVGFDVRFFNPNNQRVNLKDAEARLFVNSTYLGDTRLDSLIPVPRKDTFAVPLVLNIKSMAAIGKVMQALSDSTVDIKVEGTVKMGKAGLFKSFPIQYTRKQNVQELMQQIDGGF